VEGEVGGNTLSETQCHIDDTSVNAREVNECEIGEVTCGYWSEHELLTQVTHKNENHSRVTQELTRVNKC